MMVNQQPSWVGRVLYWLRNIVTWTREDEKQHYMTLFGLFLEWNGDGWELSWYRNWGAHWSWKITHTSSGKRIQE